jgi:hypothetical protein
MTVLKVFLRQDKTAIHGSFEELRQMRKTIKTKDFKL